MPITAAGTAYDLTGPEGAPVVALIHGLGLTRGCTYGAMIPLFLGLATMNIYTQVGLITLIGLISKHGILIVEFANQLQRQGRDKATAVKEAAALRLRPILMTTAAMVLGVMPLVLAEGAGPGVLRARSLQDRADRRPGGRGGLDLQAGGVHRPLPGTSPGRHPPPTANGSTSAAR